MKSITACVSANVYVEAQKIGSVIESPGFCRASPPWTLNVENLGAGDFVGFSGSASSSSGLLICVVLIFHHLQNTPISETRSVRCRFRSNCSRAQQKTAAPNFGHLRLAIPNCADI